MPEVTLERVIEEVKQLTDEEQRQLRGVLDSWLPTSKQQEWTPEQEALLLGSLVKKGVVTRLPSFAPDLERVRTRKPITVRGRPVSETLLEDRQ